ncbi:MAG: ADP-ribose pyrophosphatase [Myxococcaceae bacterium]|nr:ADP-ribose pyrophosphatase [Myxococcaceae bacterium]
MGRRVRVEQRRLPRRDGRTELRDMVVHPGSVVLLPLLDDGRIVLIRNRRFAVERTLLELCAGTLEPGEDVATCAARELEEETGYRARELAPLLAFFPSPGVSNERMHVFVARRLEVTSQNLDQSEQIEVEPLPLPEVLERIRGGQIEDAKTIAAVLYFHTWGAKHD